MFSPPHWSPTASLEAALELVAMGRLDGQQRQHGVMKSHVISLPPARPGTGPVT